MLVVSPACAKRSNNDIAFTTWLLRLIMSHIIKQMSSTRKCDDFKIFWFNLKKERRQWNDDSISLKSKTKNCSIFSKQSVSESKMNFLKKKLILRPKLRRKRNERTSEQRMKLTPLRQLKMNMRRNCSWII